MADIPNERRPDLSEIFDLNRHKAVRDFVERFENLMRDQDAVRNDIKELTIEAREAMFSPVEIKAMKSIAKLRKDDKANAMAESLAALRRVSNAVRFDLFTWSDEHRNEGKDQP
ncbi:DUF2312 domain-containing protein [Hoeflea sp. WL0058]|uniref:DUF2312 domain-containing protein n=1 Tax=Flavimaribacter sediminis TaxID=2865987 RepID=A0AAE3D426_9HYPH|nr:GapR family DNA-binding domain-containing protein [Flavimaribacter sediminis]MBW8640401.1 DUF2312 domain-containing protein [Flavimaribacter sediminis]